VFLRISRRCRNVLPTSKSFLAPLARAAKYPSLVVGLNLCYHNLMKNGFEKNCTSLEETKELAKKFADLVVDKGCFVSLYGEIGAGKTAFVKLVAEALEVQEKVTSPSFVILNEYHSAKIPIYHFDLYRLENEGVSTIVDELREYSEGKMLTFVEWAEFSQNEIPFNHIKINVTYGENEDRMYSLEACGEQNLAIIRGLN